MSKLAKLVYTGPLKGWIRTVMHRREVVNQYADMKTVALELIKPRIEGFTSEFIAKYGENKPELYDSKVRWDLWAKACHEVNVLYDCDNNRFGMYLFPSENGICFGFTDCEMNDCGFIKLNVN